MPDVHTIFAAVEEMYNASLDLDSMVDGSGNWDQIASTTSDEDNLIDNHITDPAKFTSGLDAGEYKSGVRLDMGSNVTVDFFAIYCPSFLSSVTVKLYGSTLALSNYAEIHEFADPAAGWSLLTFTEKTYRYFVIQMEKPSSFSNLELSELLIGSALSLKKFLKGGERDADEGVKLRKSEGGNEYTVQNYPNEKRIRSEGIGGINESLKDDLLAFKTAVRAVRYAYLFYFNDDNEYWWVRSRPGSFKIRNNGGIYQTSFTVVEQLS